MGSLSPTPSSPQIKTALVTGACSGMGLALTQHLLSLSTPTTTWRVVLADINTAAYTRISSSLPADRHIFHAGDVSNWTDSAAMFKTAFDWPGSQGSSGRIDFFAANAGIGDKEHVFGVFDLDAEPSQPNLKCLEVNLLSVFYGLKLFIHYARKTQRSLSSQSSTSNFNPNMVITASSAGLYPFAFAPQYAASKHGLVGLTRSVGPRLLASDNIALNCICPAFVVTGLAQPGLIDACPEERLTPMSTILRAFDELNTDGGDGKGGKRHTGQAVECVEKELYYRDPVEYMCEGSRWLAEDEVNGGFWDPKKAHGIAKV